MNELRLREEIKRFLDEDLGYGDITSYEICEDTVVKGEIIAKEGFVISGLSETSMVFQEMEVDSERLFEDGERAVEGDILMRVEGEARNLLSAERLALNLLMRMSGIATKVRRLIDKAPGTVIAATRKTTPGFRIFEKKAVTDGGGDPHRFRLDDMMIIKDNHIKLAGGIEESLKKIENASFSKKIDIEVTNIDDAEIAAESGVDIIMLDNMDPDEVKRAYEKIKEIDEETLVEVSGGIDEGNIERYARSADIISSGAVTHSVESVDVSMRIVL